MAQSIDAAVQEALQPLACARFGRADWAISRGAYMQEFDRLPTSTRDAEVQNLSNGEC
jgi:hypothetical protein